MEIVIIKERERERERERENNQGRIASHFKGICNQMKVRTVDPQTPKKLTLERW